MGGWVGSASWWLSTAVCTRYRLDDRVWAVAVCASVCAVEYVFSLVESRSSSKDVAVVVSFLEMYCDQIRDLGKAYLAKGDGPGLTEKTSDW